MNPGEILGWVGAICLSMVIVSVTVAVVVGVSRNIRKR